MTFLKIIVRGLIASAVAVATTGVAFAQQAFPTKPIHLLVAFPPGGSTTVVAQLLGKKMTERLGQPVIVENRPGANGVIASQDLLKAPADGYTLLMVVNTHAINPLMKASLPYNIEKDFAPVSTLYKLELVLVTHPSVKANNIAEFTSLAKKNPTSINFAAGDSGGLTHLAAETFNTEAGIKLQVIPYKGSGPALNDALGGHVQAYFSSPTAVIQHVASGALKALAISGEARSQALPSVPTFAEQGLPEFEAGTWAGILAPAGTPDLIVKKLSQEIGIIMNLPDVKAKLKDFGLDPFVTTPEDFAALINYDTARFKKIIEAADMKRQK
ncbi:hypothetical protein CR155_07950 [Pollutimonas nitritireducens]|uniref:Tripartite tricarboxylate transporter substrate binding protein n=1 Tax=Pollutimonas nitritireducens TaxID=2045209 RepID=A0A2N4UI21_9BURK|nr:tripartite tricarboxylate transporter substrate binding protein [Pollutimonas nitritireducens]PLC54672.1 hypothetical protein CR155_07950 [Pollutimonas nitritireducens]